MYMKKSTMVCWAIILVIVTAVVTVCAVNPFGFTAIKELAQFSSVTKLIRNHYYKDIDMQECVNMALEGVTWATDDPYTNYYWGQDADDYMEDMTGNYCGVGIYIEEDAEDGSISVISAIEGTPAEAAGLLGGDKILAIDGVSFTGQQINEAVAAMKGEANSEVRLTVLRKETGLTEELTLMRQEISVPNVASEMLTDTIAYIRIDQFTKGAASAFEEQYSARLEDGMEKLVLDLRNNPGGLMDEAAQIANMFIEDGKLIVYTEDKKGKRVEYTATGEAVHPPMVVLTNGFSASASELLTGALKDHEAAYQLGERTYGKGIVQSVYQLGGNEVLSITTARYFTPNGVCIHGDGIAPNEELAMSREEYQRLSKLTLGEDIQKQRAVEYLSR